MASSLLPYQHRWVKDASRFKIGLWSRQTGKSFAGTLEAVLDAVERPGTTWVMLSAGERQSRELAEKAKLHLAALRQGAEELESRFFEAGVDVTQLEIRLPNASRLIFLPANPAPPAATRATSFWTSSPSTRTPTPSGRRCSPSSPAGPT